MHSQDPALVKKSMALQKESIREGMRNYFSKADKFSVRMSHAIGNTPNPLQEVDEQQELFVDDTNLAFEGQKGYFKSSP